MGWLVTRFESLAAASTAGGWNLCESGGAFVYPSARVHAIKPVVLILSSSRRGAVAVHSLVLVAMNWCVRLETTMDGIYLLRSWQE
ncbi:hypothetical protein BRADI_3g07096v3 [Brachypodium distachyon]|uniref:Uncharacterized protein n=1 Tax=Brachypodium distachyon TaxID=15368 RepID=A0A2K2CVP5_BRADI|nr:hypothetical protein BRADI_3g07096v3 [Brachypodium distachyon]